MRRRLSGFAVLAGAAALFSAYLVETRLGRPPCALCLLERWPYRALIAFGVIGSALPLSFGRTAVRLALLAVVAAIGLAGLHVGVEQGWWPSPLAECAAPRLPFGDLAARLAALPDRPSVPCDAPTLLLPQVPVSMAMLNLGYAALIGAVLLAGLPKAARPRPAAIEQETA